MIYLNNYFIRLIKDILSYKRNSSIIIFSILLSSVIAMLGPYLIGIATDSIISLKFTLLIYLGGFYILIYMVNYFSENRRTLYMMNTSQMVIKQLRNKAFENLQYVPLKYYSEKNSGKIISRITNDAETLGDFLTFQIPQVVSGIAGIIASLFIMTYLDYRLTIYAVLIIPMLLATVFLMNKKIKFNYISVRRRIAELTGNVSESVNGVKAIKSSGAEDLFNESFENVNNNNYNANVKAVRLTSLFSSIVQVIEGFGIMIVLYEGGTQVFSGILSIGILVSFIVYVQGFFNPIVQLSQFYNSYQSSSIAVERIYKIIDEEKDKNDYKYNYITFNNNLSFNHVKFSYGKTDTINDISFTIKKGQKVAFIGKTGAGKTTIANLMLKFYTTSSGNITMDNMNINEINTENYRKLFGVILQDPFLFEGTILDNIKFANGNITDDYINKKIIDTGLNKILSRLSLNSEVGEGGSNLSEGQRQAISILRAVINNPEIIVMDEATSQLDSINEINIQNAIYKIMEDKTVIIIAHHLNTIMNSNYLFYVKNGGIIEEGEPSELIKNQSYFHELYNQNKLML